MLDDILEDQRKQSYDKSSYKIHSLKQLRQQRRNQPNSQTHNLLSPVKTSSGIQPPALSAASYAQLTINPHIFSHSSASTGRSYHTGADRTEKDDQGVRLEREQEKFQRWGREETSGIHKEPGQRTIRLQEEEGEVEVLHGVEKVVIGGKVSKKHKIK